MRNSQQKATSEFIFWFASLVILSGLSTYVLNLRLEDLGSSSVYVPPKKTKRVRIVEIEPQTKEISQQIKLPMDRPSKPVERLETSDAPEMDEEQVEQLFVAALQEIDKGNWQSGEKSLLKILAQDDENIEALRELAMLNLLDKKNPMAAKDYFQRAFSLDPNDTGVMNELLQLYEESGTLKQGLIFLKSIPEEKKTTPAVDYGIATALTSNGRVEEAISFYQKAIESSDEPDYSLSEDLADAYGQVGRTQDALEIYNTLASQIKNENDKDRMKTLQVKIVASLIDSGDIEAAKEAADDLQKQYPDDDWISTLFDSKSINF